MDGAFGDLVELLGHRRFVALTGAGCSTESGIPDYRGQGRTGPRNPIQHDAYLRRADVRQRYWARATVGWVRFSGARPNAAHLALAGLERAGALTGIITQNVDRLHHAAGSRRVVELHGALAEVRCLGCGTVEARAAVHERLCAENPGWLSRAATPTPDGDAELPDDAVAAFRVVPCARCGGVLKPDVVFFGGTVAEATLAEAWALLGAAEALLVSGRRSPCTRAFASCGARASSACRSRSSTTGPRAPTISSTCGSRRARATCSRASRRRSAPSAIAPGRSSQLRAREARNALHCGSWPSPRSRTWRGWQLSP